MKILLLKTHIDGYTKKDGTYVAPHEDKRAAASERTATEKVHSVTDTPEFKKWFGDSMVVDANGEPLVVYHGTRHDFDAFKPEGRKGRSRMHYFTNDPGVASEYAGDARYGAPNVMPAYLSLQNPYRFDAKGAQWGGLPLDTFPEELSRHFDERNILRGREGSTPLIGLTEVARAAQDAGYDGVMADNIIDGGGAYGDKTPSRVAIAFKPEQIKSAIGNRGTFDPNDSNVLKSHKAEMVIHRRSHEPTDAQKEAGNYKKRLINWNGMSIRVENDAGTVRRGPWGETRMKFDYGYVVGSCGVDGDEVDVYVGPNDDAPMVYVVHQRKHGDWDEFDEDKCMLGFDSVDDAATAYLAHYDDPRFLGPITEMPVEEFKAKVLATKDAPAMVKAMPGPRLLILKAHVRGHVKQDGTVVRPYETKVAKKHRASDSRTMDMFGDDVHVMPKKEAIEEHERLVDVLNSPSHEDDKREAKEQAQELAEMKGSQKNHDGRVQDLTETKAGSLDELVKKYGMSLRKLNIGGSYQSEAYTFSPYAGRTIGVSQSKTLARKIKVEHEDAGRGPAAAPSIQWVNTVAEADRIIGELSVARNPDGPTPQEAADPRRKYYVTMVRDPGPRQKVAYLAGPFDRHEDALQHVDRAREHAEQVDPRAVFDSFGTSGVVTDKHPPGVLNERMGIGAKDAPYVPVTDDAHPAPLPRSILSAIPEGRRAEWKDLHRQQHELHHYDMGYVREQLARARAKMRGAQTDMREMERMADSFRKDTLPGSVERTASASAAAAKHRDEFMKHRAEVDRLVNVHQSLYEKVAKLGRQKDKIFDGSGDMDRDFASMRQRTATDQEAHEKSMLKMYRQHYKEVDAANKAKKGIGAKAKNTKFHKVTLSTPFGKFDVFIDHHKDSTEDDYRRDAKAALLSDMGVGAGVSSVSQVKVIDGPVPVKSHPESATSARGAQWAKISKHEPRALIMQPKVDGLSI